MATQLIDDLQAEAPPSKRARLEQSQDLSGTPPIDVMDGTYSTGANTPTPEASKTLKIGSPKMVADEGSASKTRSIPGLGLLGQSPKEEQESTSGGKAK